MQVLSERAIPNFLKAEYPLDHPGAVLDLRANLGFVAVLCFDRLVDPRPSSVMAVRAVTDMRSLCAD